MSHTPDSSASPDSQRRVGTFRMRLYDEEGHVIEESGPDEMVNAIRQEGVPGILSISTDTPAHQSAMTQLAPHVFQNEQCICFGGWLTEEDLIALDKYSSKQKE